MFNHHNTHHNTSSIPRVILFVVIVTIVLGAIPYAVSAVELSGDPPGAIAYGETGGLPDYELTIVNVDLNAEELLHTFDPTMPHITDTAYVMVQIEARYTGDFSSSPGDAMWFGLRIDEEHTSNLDDSACERWPHPPGDVNLTPGKTARFNLCFTAPLWLAPNHDVRLVVHTNLRTDQWPQTFSLDEPETDDSKDCACLPPTPPPPPCSCVPPLTQHHGPLSGKQHEVRQAIRHHRVGPLQ